MSLFSALKNLNNILVTFSLQEEVSLAPTYHVSSQAMKIFIPGIQNAGWVFSCSFSSWEHYYLHAVKRGRQLEKLQHGNNIGKPGKLYVKHFFQCYGSKKWKLLQRKFFFFFFFSFVLRFSSLQGKFCQANLLDSHTDGQMCQNCWKQVL